MKSQAKYTMWNMINKIAYTYENRFDGVSAGDPNWNGTFDWN